MESINSFKSYGKVDELEEQAFRRQTRKRLIIITLSTIIFVTLVIGVLVGTLMPQKSSKSGDSPILSPNYSAESINAVCNVTQYPDSCFQSISSSLKSSSNKPDPENLFVLSLQVALNELVKLSNANYKNISENESLVQGALVNCKSLIEDAIDQINMSILSMQVGQDEKMLSTSKINDIRTWLSTAITDQETCLDGLLETAKRSVLAEEVRFAMRNSTEFTSNSLAIISNILTILDDFQIPMHRKLLGVDFPGWVHHGDRRLLQEEIPKPNLTVAKDGSGDFVTISEAVESIPKKSKSRFVIYVKEGEYVENVNVDKEYWNVMMYGDGMTKTIVSGSLNFVDDGTPTFSTATFIAAGRGFIGKDLGFKNTAGPEKHQAVALRSSSDQSVFYRCSFNAYQDTLYPHSNRQFYRDCHITGTVDFIFGNAAVVFQNCSIQPRQPMPKQFNTITAQGKSDKNQNTGISIQRCHITPLDNLTAPTYLGRPWKNYSTTIIGQSDIGGFLHPMGWAQWTPNVDPPNTIFYAEYQNTGLGSILNQRVEWAGYRPNITDEQAEEYNVESFIQGREWLAEASVMYDATLLTKD